MLLKVSASFSDCPFAGLSETVDSPGIAYSEYITFCPHVSQSTVESIQHHHSTFSAGPVVLTPPFSVNGNRQQAGMWNEQMANRNHNQDA